MLDLGLKISGWVQFGYKFDSPLRPDRVIYVDPTEITHKPATPPPSARFPPTLIAGGDWDRELIPLEEDIVSRVFRSRFIENRPWEDTGYIDFLQTDRSEHGGLDKREAMARCNRIEKLYKFIDREGYLSQAELRRSNSLIGELDHGIRPPVYREIAVDIGRDGKLLWHGGIHRLELCKILDINQIPVRINVRHESWQTLREQVYKGNKQAPCDHPDLRFFE